MGGHCRHGHTGGKVYEFGSRPVRAARPGKTPGRWTTYRVTRLRRRVAAVRRAANTVR
ncbi:hypothetical protein HPP92_007993 [Vanilla planifolia]|uniref:Uncharacterized protein n=1 Tax=Vanilla planifolia TaxID=51239 RepID=A0A835RNI4_VANPL|nr:hypothetical protein HPP92_007993 [Vanilla planifolia]